MLFRPSALMIFVTDICSDAYRADIGGRGVFKEFFTSLCKEVFDTNRGFWLAKKKNELYPNPHSYAMERESLPTHPLLWSRAQ